MNLSTVACEKDNAKTTEVVVTNYNLTNKSQQLVGKKKLF